MTPANLSASCLEAIKEFHAAGGVVEFFAFACVSCNEAAHVEATQLAHAKLDHAELRGDPQIERWISVEEFVGRIESSLGTFQDPGALIEARRSTQSHSTEISECFLFAFADPPYTLGSSSPADVARWWEILSRELFNNFTDLEIARWKTDWSSYFDAGLDWWGAHWWTIYNKAANLLIVVAASATD